MSYTFDISHLDYQSLEKIKKDRLFDICKILNLNANNYIDNDIVTLESLSILIDFNKEYSYEESSDIKDYTDMFSKAIDLINEKCKMIKSA